MVKHLVGGQPQTQLPKTSHCPKSLPDVARSPTAHVPPSSKQCMQDSPEKQKAGKGAEPCFSNLSAEQELRIWAFQ